MVKNPGTFAVGVPDPVKGQTIVCFWVPRAAARLARAVADGLGAQFRPQRVVRTKGSDQPMLLNWNGVLAGPRATARIGHER